jgi:hypothetical protein
VREGCCNLLKEKCGEELFCSLKRRLETETSLKATLPVALEMVVLREWPYLNGLKRAWHTAISIQKQNILKNCFKEQCHLLI